MAVVLILHCVEFRDCPPVPPLWLSDRRNEAYLNSAWKSLYASAHGCMLWVHMPLGSIIHDLWIASIALQVFLAVVLLKKEIWRQYPFFAAYVFFNLFAAGISYSLSGRGMGFFYTFWVCEAVGLVMGLAVGWEIFTNLFAPHAALRKLATVIFRVAVVFLILLACGAVYAQPGNTRGIVKAVLLASEATRIVELGSIMFLFLCSSAFGLHWRQSIFGIALGLGTCAAIELVNVTLMTHVSPAAAQVFSLVRSVSFNISLLIWLGYLLAPERAPNVGEVPKRAQLEQWNQAVMELISR